MTDITNTSRPTTGIIPTTTTILIVMMMMVVGEIIIIINPGTSKENYRLHNTLQFKNRSKVSLTVELMMKLYAEYRDAKMRMPIVVNIPQGRRQLGGLNKIRN